MRRRKRARRALRQKIRRMRRLAPRAVRKSRPEGTRARRPSGSATCSGSVSRCTAVRTAASSRSPAVPTKRSTGLRGTRAAGVVPGLRGSVSIRGVTCPSLPDLRGIGPTGRGCFVRAVCRTWPAAGGRVVRAGPAGRGGAAPRRGWSALALVTAVEALHASGGVDHTSGTRVEGVAGAGNLDVDDRVGLSVAPFHGVVAGGGGPREDGEVAGLVAEDDGPVLGMDPVSHGLSAPLGTRRGVAR